MERIFAVEGVPSICLMYRGLALRPNQRFKVNMRESELNDYREFISIISCQELKEEVKTQPQISEPIIELKQEDKEKEMVANENKHSRSNRQTKNKSVN